MHVTSRPALLLFLALEAPQQLFLLGFCSALHPSTLAFSVFGLLCLNALPSALRRRGSSGEVFRPPHQGHRWLYTLTALCRLFCDTHGGKFTLCCVDACLMFDPLVQLVGLNTAHLYPVLLTTESSLLSITL